MLPAPDGFLDLRDYLHKRRIDAAWIRTVLDQYLAEYENRQTDSPDLDLDHQVYDYRRVIVEFKTLIEHDNQPELEPDKADGGGPETAGNAGGSRPRPRGAAGGSQKPAGRPAPKRR